MTEAAPTASRIAEERRLFYVACTRARSPAGGHRGGRHRGGGRPAVPLPDRARRAGPGPRRAGPAGRCPWPRWSASCAGSASTRRRRPRLREQAASRLARLADAADADGRPLAPGGRPATAGGGMRPLSSAARPVVAPDEPVRLSGSQLAGVLACPRQWFLSRQARAESVRSTAASFGSVIHVLADHGARTGADLAELTDHLDAVWRQLDFDANWLSAVERVEAESALERFVTWQEARTGSGAAGHRGGVLLLGRPGRASGSS